MAVSAWISGIVGGLCAVMGIITALALIPEVAALTWLFWMMLSAIFLLVCIAFSIGSTILE